MYRRQLLLCIIVILCRKAVPAQSPVLYFDKTTVQNGLSRNKVNCILRDQRGFMWFGTHDGLTRYDGHNFMVFRHRPGDSTSIAGNVINDLLEDEQGILWIATADGGLCRYDHRQLPDRQFKQYRHQAGVARSIPVNTVNKLLPDRQGGLWIGSGGAGLLRFDRTTESFTQPVPDGPRSVLALAHGGNDSLWVAYADGGMLALHTRIPGHATKAACADRYARLPQEEQPTPRVQFTGFRIFNEPRQELLQDSCIRLSYGQNYFTVLFAVPGLPPGHIVRYAYQLEGRDDDWIDIGARNTLEFSHLEAKDYVLKVRATSHAGRWNNEVTSLAISILPPFWQRWWFYAICGFSIGVIFYLVYRYRIDQLLKQQTIRNKIAQDLHDHVGSTLSSISVYSQVARIYHEQSRRTELQQTLEKISATSVEMISEMNDIVWTINPRHDGMDTILQRMESFARPLLASQGIHFHFEVEAGVKTVNLEMSRRKNFYLIYKEAVNNALKYSQCKNLWVKIGLRQHQLHLVTVDDGVGFDMQAVQLQAAQSLSGNGLRNMEMRAEEMKGLWQIDSLAGRGTTIHLRFPVV